MLKNRNKIISIILSIVLVVVYMQVVSVNAISNGSNGFSIVKTTRTLKENDSLYNDNYTYDHTTYNNNIVDKSSDIEDYIFYYNSIKCYRE